LSGTWVPDDEDPTTGSYLLIEPETVLAYETGVKSRWLDNLLQVNGAVFYYDYENLHTYKENSHVGGGVRLTDTGIPKVKYAGLELEIVAQPIDNLLISLGLGYVENEIEEWLKDAEGMKADPDTGFPVLDENTGFPVYEAIDLVGNKVQDAPDFDFNAMVRYDIHLFGGVLTPQFDCSYLGAYYPNNKNIVELGEDWTFNARLIYRTDNGVSVNLFVENIADEKHIVRIGRTPDIMGMGMDLRVDGPPRTYGVSIRYDF